MKTEKVKCSKCNFEVKYFSGQDVENIFGDKSNIIQCQKCGAEIKIAIKSEEAGLLMMDTMRKYAKKHGFDNGFDKGGLRPKNKDKNK